MWSLCHSHCCSYADVNRKSNTIYNSSSTSQVHKFEIIRIILQKLKVQKCKPIRQCYLVQKICRKFLFIYLTQSFFYFFIDRVHAETIFWRDIQKYIQISMKPLDLFWLKIVFSFWQIPLYFACVGQVNAEVFFLRLVSSRNHFGVCSDNA